MAFDPSVAPLVVPYALDSSYGLPASVVLTADPANGLQTIYGGLTVEVKPTGNLLNLAQLTTAGLVVISNPGLEMTTCVVVSGTGIGINNPGGIGGQIDVYVVPSTTLQFHNTQVNSADVGNPYDTLNLIAGSGITLSGHDNGFQTQVTISATTGSAANTDHYVVTQNATDLTNSTNLGLLTTGLLKSTVSTGVATLSTAVANTDYQAADSDLTDISALTPSNGSLLYRSGGHWIALASSLTNNQVLTTISANTLGWTSGGSIASGWSQYPATQNVDMDGNAIQNLLDPVSAQDAVTKAYADGLVGGAPIGAFYVITQANGTLTNEVNLGALTSGLVTSTVSTGVSTLSILDPATFVRTTGDQTVAGIKTFSSAPVMSGASITAATVPIASVVGTAMDLTTTQTAAGVKTFSSAPVMSGASITAATIPIASVVGTAMDLTTAQTAAGVKTFSSAPVMSGASITSATIPIASVVGTAVNLVAAQTIGGNKTFSNKVVLTSSLQYATGAFDGYIFTSDGSGNASWTDGTSLLSNWSSFTAVSDVAMDSFRITGMGDPMSDQDAVNLDYFNNNAVQLTLNQVIDGSKTFTDTTTLANTTVVSSTSISSDFIASGYSGSNIFSSAGFAHTTDATPTIIVSIPLSEGQTVTLSGYITAAQSDHSNAVGGNFVVTARRASGGNITLAGTHWLTVNTDTAATFDVAANTGTQTLNILVTGIAATTYNWVSNYTYQKVLTNA